MKQASARREYVENMVGTDYTLCVRGAGNYSYRYFDTLGTGRIPLLVDTDGGIPYDFLLDWREAGPIVSVRDLRHLPEALLDFHHSLHPDDFLTLQVANRTRYEEYLTPEGFFRNLPLHFVHH
jgi:hypothetical protein